MFKLKMSTANAAFDEPHIEIARILRDTADQIQYQIGLEPEARIRDINGNTVGKYEYQEG